LVLLISFPAISKKLRKWDPNLELGKMMEIFFKLLGAALKCTPCSSVFHTAILFQPSEGKNIWNRLLSSVVFQALFGLWLILLLCSKLLMASLGPSLHDWSCSFVLLFLQNPHF